MRPTLLVGYGENTVKILDIIKERVDPEELIDILGMETDELVELLHDTILDNVDRFDYLDTEEEEDNE